MEQVAKMLFRAGRELAEGLHERALKTARQAKRRARKRGQGRLEHQADRFLASMRKIYPALPVEEEEKAGVVPRGLLARAWAFVTGWDGR